MLQSKLFLTFLGLFFSVLPFHLSPSVSNICNEGTLFLVFITAKMNVQCNMNVGILNEAQYQNATVRKTRIVSPLCGNATTQLMFFQDFLFLLRANATVENFINVHCTETNGIRISSHSLLYNNIMN